MELCNFKEYSVKITHKRGITDLKPEYAFIGIDGSFEPTNDLAFYLTNIEWMAKTIELNESPTQEYIDNIIAQNKIFNIHYIKGLKILKSFGEEN